MGGVERDIKIRRANALQDLAINARRDRKFGEAAFKMLDAAVTLDQLGLLRDARRLRLSAAFLEYREGKKNDTEGFPLLGAIWYRSSGLLLLSMGHREGRRILEKVRRIYESSGTSVARANLEAMRRDGI